MNQSQRKQVIGLNKLERLANFLLSVPKDQFDYTVFGLCKTDAVDLVKSAKHSCCTHACALGWATVLWPKEIKLVATIYKPQENINFMDIQYKDKKSHGMSAGAMLFNISLDEAFYLFHISQNNLPYTATPKQVSKHIMRFINEKREEMTKL